MKIGVIGTGFIVRAVMKNMALAGGYEFEAVYSRKQETGEKLAGEFGFPKVYTDLEAMFCDDRVETVYIASPNSLHYAQAKAALEHGKHAIVEKPFTSTAREAEELMKLAEEKHLFLFEAITTAYLPNYTYIREKLPELGRLRMVLLNFSQYSSRYDAFLAGGKPNVFNPEFSGGALQDINLYNIHFTLGLFGVPENGVYYPNMHQNGIDTSGVLVMEYPDFRCVCEGAKDTVGVNGIQIQGEKGYMQIPGESSRCKEVILALRGQEPVHYNGQEQGELFYEMKRIRELIEAGDREECCVRLEKTLQVVSFMENVRKKAGIFFPADHRA